MTILLPIFFSYHIYNKKHKISVGFEKYPTEYGKQLEKLKFKHKPSTYLNQIPVENNFYYGGIFKNIYHILIFFTHKNYYFPRGY